MHKTCWPMKQIGYLQTSSPLHFVVNSISSFMPSSLADPLLCLPCLLCTHLQWITKIISYIFPYHSVPLSNSLTAKSNLSAFFNHWPSKQGKQVVGLSSKSIPPDSFRDLRFDRPRDLRKIKYCCSAKGTL